MSFEMSQVWDWSKSVPWKIGANVNKQHQEN